MSATPKPNRVKKHLPKVLVFVATLVIFALYIYPFTLVIINAFKDMGEVLRNPMALPERFNWDNFIRAYETMNFTTAFTNSLLITTASVIIVIVFSSMLAYFLVRWKFRINKVIFTVMILSMMVPFQVVMLPFVIIYGNFLGMLDNRWTLVLAYLGFGVAQATFLYHGFIKGIPVELEEAATVDGAGRLRTFFTIIFPILKPITSTVAILNVLWIWNDFLLPSLVLISAENRTIPLSTFAFFGRFTTDFGASMAALLLAVVPIIVFYLALQKHIIKGISDGAIK